VSQIGGKYGKSDSIGYNMTPQDAINNIDVRFMNYTERQLLHLEEWEVIKAEIQRLKRIEDSVKMMGVGNE